MRKALEQVQAKIKQCALGREVQLVAVSKTVDVTVMREAYEGGIRDFGENKVQELLQKQAALPPDIHWHMIGRLQTNKVKDLVGKTALIHSLDRFELYQKLNLEARKQAVSNVDCLLQLNVSGEATKAGFDRAGAEEFLKRFDFEQPVRLRGLMTMAPLTDDLALIHKTFAETKGYFELWKKQFPKFAWEYLSMGMSSDFEIAIEEGSTMVRIGTALFGIRS